MVRRRGPQGREHRGRIGVVQEPARESRDGHHRARPGAGIVPDPIGRRGTARERRDGARDTGVDVRPPVLMDRGGDTERHARRSRVCVIEQRQDEGSDRAGVELRPDRGLQSGERRLDAVRSTDRGGHHDLPGGVVRVRGIDRAGAAIERRDRAGRRDVGGAPGRPGVDPHLRCGCVPVQVPGFQRAAARAGCGVRRSGAEIVLRKRLDARQMVGRGVGRGLGGIFGRHGIVARDRGQRPCGLGLVPVAERDVLVVLRVLGARLRRQGARSCVRRSGDQVCGRDRNDRPVRGGPAAGNPVDVHDQHPGCAVVGDPLARHHDTGIRGLHQADEARGGEGRAVGLADEHGLLPGRDREFRERPAFEQEPQVGRDAHAVELGLQLLRHVGQDGVEDRRLDGVDLDHVPLEIRDPTIDVAEQRLEDALQVGGRIARAVVEEVEIDVPARHGQTGSTVAIRDASGSMREPMSV